LKLCLEVPSEIGGKNAGFTIIEVLVAIAVVAISLTAIGALTGTTTRGVRSLEQHVALVETTRTVVASLPPRAQLSLGEVAGEIYGSRWRMGVSPFFGDAAAPVPDSPWSPARVTIHVQSPSGATLSLETIRLQQQRKGQ
jgi:general secretion pathway protein I